MNYFMKRTTITLLLMFALANSYQIFAQTIEWIGFYKSEAAPPETQVGTSDAAGTDFYVGIPGMNIQGAVYNSSFARLSLPEHGVTTDLGLPELPVIRQLIAVPEGANVTVNYNLGSPTNLGGLDISPVPEIVVDTDADGNEYLREEFYINSQAYSTNAFFPMNDYAEINNDGSGYIRGQRFVEVLIYPIRYNPVTKELVAYPNIEVAVYTNDGSQEVTVNTGLFSNICSQTLINYNMHETAEPVMPDNNDPGQVQWVTLSSKADAANITADYLIITDQQFWDNADIARLAAHRAAYNGFDVAICGVENILDKFELQGDYFSKERAIREFIKYVYNGANAQHTFDGKLAYVLLVGDTGGKADNMPMPTSYDHKYGNAGIVAASDYYFTCITTDNANEYDVIGDLYIGRFSVEDTDDLFNMTEKTINYETVYNTGDWRNESTVVCGDIFLSLNLSNYLKEHLNGFITDYNLTFYDYYNGEDIYGSFISKLNEGTFLVNYLGHGNTNKWALADPTYDDLSDDRFISQVNNTNKYPIVIAEACRTGEFDAAEQCMAEKLTTYSPNKGVVGYAGASIGMWVGTAYDMKIGDNYTATIPTLFGNFVNVVGEAFLSSKIIINSTTNSFIMNYFGDPAVSVVTDYGITDEKTISQNSFVITNPIYVKNGGTLNLSVSELQFTKNGKIIVEEGGNLNLDLNWNKHIYGVDVNDYAIEVYGNCNIVRSCKISNCRIIHNGTGTMGLTGLALENGAQISLGANVSVIHNYGYEININDPNSFLKIEGNLELHRGLTVSGSGRIDLSGTISTEEANNKWLIFAGDSPTQTILSVTNNELFIPSDIATFKVSNGQIYLSGTNTCIKTTSANTYVALNNVTVSGFQLDLIPPFSSTISDGIYLYQTENVSIINTTFKNLEYGLLYESASGSNPFLLSGITFENCNYGLTSIHGSAELSNCTFTNNNYGWYANYIDNTSLLEQCNFTDNVGTGVHYYGYTGADLYINDCNFNGGQYGVHADGNLNLIPTCSNFNNYSEFGIGAHSLATVNISSDVAPSSGYCNLSGNVRAVYGYNAANIFAHNGYNDFTTYFVNQDKTNLTGSFQQLQYGQSFSGNVWGMMYGMYLYEASYLTNFPGGSRIAIFDSYPLGSYSGCSLKLATMGADETISVFDDAFQPSEDILTVQNITSKSFKNLPLNQALGSINQRMLQNKEVAVNISLLLEVITYSYGTLNVKEEWYLNLAMNMLTQNMGKLKKANFPELMSGLKQALKSLNNSSGAFISKKELKVQVAITYAHSLHAAGESTEALTILSKVLKKLKDANLQSIVQQQICMMELDLSGVQLTPEEFELQREQCGIDSKKSGQLYNENSDDGFDGDRGNQLTVYPNPVSGTSTISGYINTDNNTAQLCVFNATGKTLIDKTIDSGQFEFAISNTDIPEGIYMVVVSINGTPVKTQKMLVIK